MPCHTKTWHQPVSKMIWIAFKKVTSVELYSMSGGIKIWNVKMWCQRRTFHLPSALSLTFHSNLVFVCKKRHSRVIKTNLWWNILSWLSKYRPLVLMCLNTFWRGSGSGGWLKSHCGPCHLAGHIHSLTEHRAGENYNYQLSIRKE